MMVRIAAGLLFAALLAAGARPSILRLLLPPHRPPAAPAPERALHRWPLRYTNDPSSPEVVRFFTWVRANTVPGERIALVLAPPFDGPGYAYWRASYELTGRVVLPAVFDLADADTIAVWKTFYGDPRFALAGLDGHGGALLRRKR